MRPRIIVVAIWGLAPYALLSYAVEALAGPGVLADETLRVMNLRKLAEPRLIMTAERLRAHPNPRDQSRSFERPYWVLPSRRAYVAKPSARRPTRRHT